jgi:hypothetical protein
MMISDLHKEKVWLVQYGKIRGTELEARIPAEFLSGSRKL